MLKQLLFAALIINFACALSINDQISLYVREGENRTAAEFFIGSDSLYFLFINCLPAAILVESNGELAPLEDSRTADMVAEYIRRGYKGCNNETLDLNSSVASILYQTSSRSIEARGKISSLDREEFLKLRKDQRKTLALKLNSERNIEFPLLDAKIDEMERHLANLRRVRSVPSIERLSSDFDRTDFEAKMLLENYEATLPYYYPAAMALSNASIAIRNAQKRYGEDDPWLISLSRQMLALEAELNALEKDMALGISPSASDFSSIALRAYEIQKKAGRRGPELPWYYVYSVVFLAFVLMAIAAFVKIRTPKKIVADDVPKIQKLLQKLRKIEQKEEEER